MIALKVTITFAVVSGLWIFFSDQLLGALVQDPKTMADLSTAKGWFYVLVVSVILFAQIRQYVARINAAHQEVLRHQEKLLLFEFTVDKSTDMVLWIDPDNHVLYANRSAVRELEYSAEALTALSIQDLEDGGQSPVEQIWAQLFASGSAQFHRRFRTSRGRIFPVEVRVDLVKFQGKAFANAWIRDISDRLQVEEQVRQSQKLEAVGTLAAGVAHDINNILTVIQGCSELLSLSVGDPERTRPLVAQIQAAVRRAADLVRGLLAFSRNEKPRLQKFLFNDLVLKMEEFLTRVLGSGVRLEFHPCDAPTMVEADPSQWEQVILNLAVNARDAMAGTGTLTLATEVSESRVVLSVRDSGPGISPDIVARIFEPFFTTKETGLGTGLGLSIVYGIVKQHRGTIRVDSPPKGGTARGGTEFTLTLPLADSSH